MVLNNSYGDDTRIDTSITNSTNTSYGSTITHILFQILLYGLGLFLQVKIIITARKEKDTTWQIYIAHSIVLIIYYSFTIPFDAIMYFVPSLSSYTGSWLCYIASFVTLYCVYAMQIHSLVVSIMKFAFIVHDEKIRELGIPKAQKIFLWINLCFPLFCTVCAILTSDWDAFSSLNRCFGQQEQILARYNTSSGNIMKFFICDLDDNGEGGTHTYVLYIIKQCCCVSKSVVMTIITSNLPEAFFYRKIFRKMRT